MRSVAQRCDAGTAWTPRPQVGCSLNWPQAWEKIPLLALETGRGKQNARLSKVGGGCEVPVCVPTH